MSDWLRPAVVAGRFYPDNEKKLREVLATFLRGTVKKDPAKAILAPHAGYIYSGRIAGEVYRRVHIPDTVVVLCPNHTGRGTRISIWGEGAGETPLGEVPIDETTASQLLKSLGLESDRLAHQFEHAIEVHLPFLQMLNPKVRIVPVVIGPLQMEDCRPFGRALYELTKQREDILVVASSDMSHYISVDEAKRLDDIALEKIKRVDADGLYQSVVEKDISMCGFIPTTCTLEMLRARGVRAGTLVAYGHSGEVSHDTKSVVAYASALFQ